MEQKKDNQELTKELVILHDNGRSIYFTKAAFNHNGILLGAIGKKVAKPNIFRALDIKKLV